MAKVTLPSLKLPPFTLSGSSVAGIATSLIVKELNLCFDVANGWEPLTTLKNLLITHGHMDHVGGLPYILSQKAMTSQPPPNVYVPAPLVEPMRQLLRLWQQIEGHEYDFRLIPADLTKNYPLKGGFFFRAFPTVHRVPSNGYTIFESKKRLNAAFHGKSREEILRAKDSGIEVEEQIDTPLLSFTGDTQIEFLDGPEWVRRSKYLCMEVSFIDQKRTVEQARYWGHIHFDEFVANYSRLENEKIVLLHLSKRYRVSEAEQKIIDAGLDPERVLVMPQLEW